MKAFADVEKGLFTSPRMPILNSRSVQGAILVILLITLSLSLASFYDARQMGDSVLKHSKDIISKVAASKPKEPKMARRLDPKDLMQRPLATDLTSIPKYFHQSWMNETLPTKFEEWSVSCRKAHPDWEWILWTDGDNFDMVVKYAPWFMHTYEFFTSEIYRADTARNIYMHVFGGVYADLDTECLLSYDSMFENYNVCTSGYSEDYSHNSLKHGNKDKEKASQKKESSKTRQALLPQVNAKSTAERKAFLGRMGTDDKFGGSIPNAWMASTPGHPFWLLPLEAAEKLSRLPGIGPERTTGPNALKNQVNLYNREFRGGKGLGGKKLDRHYARSGWRHLYKAVITSVKAREAAPQSLVILPTYEIYPYSWWRDGDMFREACALSAETFDAKRCKLLLGLEYWGGHSITYWGHSWSNENKKQKANDEKEGSGKVEGDEQKKGDAVEANRQAEAKKKQEEEREKQLEKRLAGAMLQRRRRI